MPKKSVRDILKSLVINPKASIRPGQSVARDASQKAQNVAKTEAIENAGKGLITTKNSSTSRSVSIREKVTAHVPSIEPESKLAVDGVLRPAKGAKTPEENVDATRSPGDLADADETDVAVSEQESPEEDLPKHSRLQIELDDLHEAQAETRGKGLSRGETAADLDQLANRIVEAESGLARAEGARFTARSVTQCGGSLKGSGKGGDSGKRKLVRRRPTRKS